MLPEYVDGEVKLKRNVAVLVLLVLGQLAAAYVLEFVRDLVEWSWEVRLTVAIGVFAAIGGAASLLFAGEVWKRVVWTAGAVALPSIVAEATLGPDPAAPYLGYFLAVPIAAIAALAAYVMLLVVGHVGRRRTSELGKPDRLS